MHGSVCYDKKTKRYYVNWYDPSTQKTEKLWFYHGDKNIPFRKGKSGRELAQRMLDQMRGEYELNTLNIEKYKAGGSNVVPHLRKWIENEKPSLARGTYPLWLGYIKNHLVPFFESKGLQLHEIQYDSLKELMNTLPLSGKGKLNVLSMLHRSLVSAVKSKKLTSVPLFPERKEYQIIEPVIRWLPSHRQENVLNAIPKEDQPIFRWMAMHLRRPGEACAIYMEDYDPDLEDGMFYVHRGISYHQEVDQTKDKSPHNIPCHKDFKPYIDLEKEKRRIAGVISPYMFVYLGEALKCKDCGAEFYRATYGGNAEKYCKYCKAWKRQHGHSSVRPAEVIPHNVPQERQGRPYSEKILNRIWKEACQKAKENISLYAGTKHSTASQMRNEDGYSLEDIQQAGDWASIESAKRYAKTEIAKKRALLERKIRPVNSTTTS